MAGVKVTPWPRGVAMRGLFSLGRVSFLAWVHGIYQAVGQAQLDFAGPNTVICLLTRETAERQGQRRVIRIGTVISVGKI